MKKKCPHCGNEFECKEDDILNCACITVTLSPETRQQIASLYAKCLCVDCLKQFEQNTCQAKQRS